jgi:hypothetical protein
MSNFLGYQPGAPGLAAFARPGNPPLTHPSVPDPSPPAC